MRSNRTFARSGGWSLAELVVAVGFFGIMVAVATPYFLKISRHYRLLGQVHEVQSTLLAARMQAIKRNQQVVVQFFVSDSTNCPGGGSCAITFVDNNGNFKQDVGEPTIGTYAVAQQQRVFFLNPVNPQAAYCARPAKPGSYTAKVPSGSINCAAGDCRGIYITNDPSTSVITERDTFRISVEDFGSNGKVSVLKWLPTAHGGNAGEVNFVPGSPWIWLD
jgi:Tfp pilus assembly protein FimT